MVLFDIYHLPQWNFLRNAIHEVPAGERIVTCVDRSKLVAIIKRELHGGEFRHYGTYRFNFGFASMVMLIIVPRIFWLIWLLKKRKVTMVVSANYQSNLAARFWGIPNIVFNDDPRKGVIPIARFAADVIFVTKGLQMTGAKELNCLKEWAYLSPRYMEPDIRAVKEIGLQPFDYLMFREVSTNTTNYSHQKAGMLISQPVPSNMAVVLSLEDKARLSSVPKDWIVLEEPVNDIHSLMFFCRGFVSTGDSMAREAAELGVPSFYSGTRDMVANRVLMDMGLLRMEEPTDAVTALTQLPSIENVDEETARRQAIRAKLSQQWDDVNEIIKYHIKQGK